MKLFLGFALLMSISTVAYAEDSTSTCDQVSDSAWSCQVPKKPLPPPTCHVYGDDLICTAPIDEKKPANCGFNKAGKYICW